MLPTPSTSHVDYTTIYEPSTDSFLLLDTLTSESTFLQTHFVPTTPSPLCIEIGTGSGIVLSFLTSHATTLFGRRDIVTLGIDVNALASTATVKTVTQESKLHGSKAGVYLGSVVGDLAGALKNGVVDFLVFNPPYVPTPEVPQLRMKDGAWEEESRLLALTYAGGKDGMEVTWRVLEGLEDTLSERGVAYVLLCRQNQPEEVCAWLEGRGWRTEKVGSSGKKGGIEALGVWRVWRQ
jgi:release factor glutamine methyltransferase